ncbi:MAG: ATP-binding cassette domain-containing protein [Coriobacteriales bacterium]|nr:ATP-binding cassette domain-containing protein [Coriobacteriales bacterium]
MDKTTINAYRAMAHARSAASEASTFDEALRTVLRILAREMGISVAVLWYLEPDKKTLRPYFWIGNVDLMGASCVSGEGVVGRVHKTQASERLCAYEPGTDPVLEACMGQGAITSMLVHPITTLSDRLCVAQLVNKDDGSAFTSEEADVCEMLAMLSFRIAVPQEIPKRPFVIGDRMLLVRNITRDYVSGDTVTHVLKGVNLSVNEGELVVLLGESGCGKSTLLNIIAGMESATDGVVEFRGEPIVDASEDDLTEFRRQNIGFVFQSYHLMPNLNARENLSLIGELVDDAMTTDDALEVVGLQDRKENLPSQLSGGQQQRVSIARALVKRPGLLFADEPTAALDYDTSIDVLQALKKIVDGGTTMMMVTHNEEICRMADRVVRIRNGRVGEVTINRTIAAVTDLEW